MDHKPAGTAALWPFTIGALLGFAAFVYLVPSVATERGR